jgi:hypothetical protein
MLGISGIKFYEVTAVMSYSLCVQHVTFDHLLSSNILILTFRMENVRTFVSDIFNEEDANKIVQHLQEIGAESMDDVLRLQVDSDLRDILPVLKRRRLGDKLETLKQSVTGDFQICKLDFNG